MMHRVSHRLLGINGDGFDELVLPTDARLSLSADGQRLVVIAPENPTAWRKYFLRAVSSGGEIDLSDPMERRPAGQSPHYLGTVGTEAHRIFHLFYTWDDAPAPTS